jgi:hypothetical protein
MALNQKHWVISRLASYYYSHYPRITQEDINEIIATVHLIIAQDKLVQQTY